MYKENRNAEPKEDGKAVPEWLLFLFAYVGSICEFHLSRVGDD